jgi:hypothetical protein
MLATKVKSTNKLNFLNDYEFTYQMQIELFDEQRSLSLFNSSTQYQSKKLVQVMLIAVSIKNLPKWLTKQLN